VLSGLASLLGILGGSRLVVASDSAEFRARVVDELERRHVDLQGVDVFRLIDVLGWVVLAIGVLAVVGIVAGILVLNGSNAMRVLLIVLAALTAVVSLVLIMSGVSVIWLVGSILVIVFLVRTEARDWFSQR
jgi:hypothetical protein